MTTRVDACVDRAAAPHAPARRPLLEGVVAAVVIAAVLYGDSVSRHLIPGAFNDDAAYLALGRALASGAGYHSIYLVGSPLQVKYPPGLPAVLAALWAIARTPERVHALAVAINIAACAGAAGMLWWIARARLALAPVLVGVFVMLTFVLDPAVQYFTLVLSEPLFLLAMCSAFLLYDRLAVCERDAAALRGTAAARAVALGLAIAASVLMRTQGWALLVAIAVALVFDRVRWRELVIVAACALTPTVAWSTYEWLASRHAALPTQASEQSYAAFLLLGSPAAVALREARVVGANLHDYAVSFATYVCDTHTAGWIIGSAVALLAVVGGIELLRRSRALGCALVANVIVLLAWPVYQDRLLLPVLPLFGLAVAVGAQIVLDRLPSRVRRARVALAVIVLVGGALCLARQAIIRRDAVLARRYGRAPAVLSPSFWLPMNAAFVSAVSQWAREATQPNDRIAVVAPAGLWLYTGRQTVPMEIVEPRGAPSVLDVPGRYLAARLVADSVTVVVVESPTGFTAREVNAVQAACPHAFTLVPGVAGFTVVRARPGDACVRALDARLRS